MAREHIVTYLNDHLAGATGAVELLEHLEKEHADTEVGRLAAELHADVEADRQALKSLMERLEIAQSRTRKAAAWLGEKAAELKLRLDDPAGGSLRLFESLEALSLGIEGKKSLWRALATAAEEAPHLRVADYEGLIRRAEEQRSRVETARLEAARRTLA